MIGKHHLVIFAVIWSDDFLKKLLKMWTSKNSFRKKRTTTYIKLKLCFGYRFLKKWCNVNIKIKRKVEQQSFKKNPNQGVPRYLDVQVCLPSFCLGCCDYMIQHQNNYNACVFCSYFILPGNSELDWLHLNRIFFYYPALRLDRK